jgi:hypothetical protein
VFSNAVQTCLIQRKAAGVEDSSDAAMCQQCQLSAVYAQWRHVYHTDLRTSEEREGWPQHYSLQAKRTANVLESRFAVVLDN